MAAVNNVGSNSNFSALTSEPQNSEQSQAFAAAMQTASTALDGNQNAPDEAPSNPSYDPEWILSQLPSGRINVLRSANSNPPSGAAADLEETGPLVDEVVTSTEQEQTVSPAAGGSPSTPALALPAVLARATAASALSLYMAEAPETVIVSAGGPNTPSGGEAPPRLQQQIAVSEQAPVVASNSAAGAPPVPPGQPPAPPVGPAGEPPEPQSGGVVKTLTKAFAPFVGAGKWAVHQDWRLGVQARLRTGIYSEGSQATGLGHLLKKVPVADLNVGQPTWKSWGVAVGTKGNWHLLPEAIKQSFHAPKDAKKTFGKWANETFTTSVRSREDLNTTVAQFSLAFMSKQSVFQFKGSDLLKAAEQILFSGDEGSALDVIPRSAKIVGDAELGNGKVVELTYSLGVKADTNVALPAGEVAFFGERAGNEQRFARLDGDLTYTKLFEEIKFYPGASVGPLAKVLPVRVRTEMRPEVPGQRTISDGEIVSRQFLVQNKAVLEQTRLKIQFTVDGQADLTAFLKVPSVVAIREMAQNGVIKAFDEEGRFDRTLVRSWVPSHYVIGDGGLRLSAVSEKPALKTVTDLRGKKTVQWDEAQTNLDVVFMDPLTMLPGKAAWLNPVLAPDRWVSQAGHWIAQKVTAVNDHLPTWLQFKRLGGYINDKLPSWLQFNTPPVHYLPTPGAVYEAMTGPEHQFAATSGTRYTLSVQSPNLNFIPFTPLLAGSLEARAQLKTEEQSVAPAIKKSSDLVTHEYTDPHTGSASVVKVPGWLSQAINWSRQTRSHLLVPKGSYDSLNDFLNQIGSGSSRQAAISDFRNTLLPLFREPTSDNPNPAYTGFLSPRHLDDIERFLSQFGRPEGRLDFSAWPLPPYQQGYGPVIRP